MRYVHTKSIVFLQHFNCGRSDTFSSYAYLQKKPLTLQERSQIQRQKQLDFLKKKGLIHDNDDVSGGAGVGSSSVASKEGEERGNEDIDVGGFV